MSGSRQSLALRRLRRALGLSRHRVDPSARVRALVEEAPGCTLICNAELTVEYASDPLRPMLGHEPDQAVGTGLRQWLDAEGALKVDEAVAASRARNGEAVPMLLRMRHADGRWHWIEASLRDLRDRPAVAGIVLNCQDVGERELARQELARAQEQLNITLDSAQMALWDLDMASNEVRLSPQWSKLVASPPGETRSTLYELASRVHSEDLGGLRNALKGVLVGDVDVYRSEHRVRTDDGRWVWIESVGRVVERDAAGRALRLAGVNIDIGARRQAQAQLADYALHDALTDLPNRALLIDRVTQAISHAERHRETTALVLLDIDRFAHVNEVYGHDTGDALLCEVADRLRQPLVHGETLARVGADRFAVALPALAGSDQAAIATQALLQTLAAPFMAGGTAIGLSVSAGISICPLDGQDATALLRSADIALAQAKAAGPGQMQFCDPQMSARARRRMTLERDLRGAIERGDLSVAYQPVVHVASRRISGAEALARWIHPTEGEVSPAEFIPIAEASGLIIALGQWVLQQACAQARAWQRGIAPDFRIAVNLSPRQLQDRGLVAMVQATLAASGLLPGTLELEITESEVVGDDAQTLELLRRLQRDTGARLVIDDFGTGYASLAGLRRMPVDKLKIDRSFVEALTSDETDAALVAGILSMAQALLLDVTVEGVETPAQLARLAVMGCRTVQGHLLGKPMTAAELTRRLRAAAVPTEVS